MAATIETVAALVLPADAAAYALLSEAQVQAQLDWAACVLGRIVACAPCGTQMHALLALHNLAEGAGWPSITTSNAITAEANGPASRAFGASVASKTGMGGDALYGGTPYGRMFLQRKRTLAGFGAGVSAAGCGTEGFC